MAEARDYLTALPGVGRKTAACVLLFAFGLPDVPVDTHVSRVGTRLGLFRPGAPFEELHDELLRLTPAGGEVELHINLLRHGRRTCHAQRPACGDVRAAPDVPLRPGAQAGARISSAGRLTLAPFVERAVQRRRVLSQLSVTAPAASVWVSWTPNVPEARLAPAVPSNV